MAGAAGIHPHGQTRQYTTKMIFQPRPLNLLAVKEAFQVNKTNHGVDEQRTIFSCHPWALASRTSPEGALDIEIF